MAFQVRERFDLCRPLRPASAASGSGAVSAMTRSRSRLPPEGTRAKLSAERNHTRGWPTPGLYSLPAIAGPRAFLSS